MNRGKTVKNLAVAALRWHAKKTIVLSNGSVFYVLAFGSEPVAAEIPSIELMTS